jgi:hypothetical protein
VSVINTGLEAYGAVTFVRLCVSSLIINCEPQTEADCV